MSPLSLLTCLQLNTKSGPDPGPGGQVSGSILHPAGGLSTADFSEGEEVGAWRTQPGNALSTKQCSWCSGLHLSSWSPFPCRFSLGGTNLKSGWAVEDWVPQSICTRLVASCESWSSHSPPQARSAFVLCQECQ